MGKFECSCFNKGGGALQLMVVDDCYTTVTVPNVPDLIDILAMNGVDISILEGEGGTISSILSVTCSSSSLASLVFSSSSAAARSNYAHKP
ncbi:ATP-dependent zinc metalloprotease FTSH 5, chloroplastic [Dendrobium catenatum]|uniref:ATP-dependent zinc metalloprotease FTSH 5, chloroplastic n=1 Tax=Dendrobium catenatum TaxID=906689 RepID=A0A2I0WRJ5_9ASPA|nr:ATP-dependent zinc metalloprotease FTSH 5, chloroplastic [Dendrobium catenatum]